jgi:hypothetical protein
MLSSQTRLPAFFDAVCGSLAVPAWLCQLSTRENPATFGLWLDQPTRDDRDRTHELPQRNNRRKYVAAQRNAPMCVQGSKRTVRRADERSLFAGRWFCKRWFHGCCPGSFSGSKNKHLPISVLMHRTRSVDAQSVF